MKSILFISNGLGEDSMTASIISRLPDPTQIDAYPLIGPGAAYSGICNIVGPRADVPSQGWRHAKWSVLRDLGAILAMLPSAIAFLRQCRGKYGQVVVVGDTSVIILGVLARLKVDLYIDVFKTGYAHRYSPIEKWALSKLSPQVLCRDDMLAEQLQKAGIKAVSHGNIMLDTVTRGDIVIDGPPEGMFHIGLLPGSRHGAPTAFSLMVTVLEEIARERPVVGLAALVDGIDIADIAAATDLTFKPEPHANEHALGELSGRGVVIRLYRQATENVIEASDIVFSQAGTATHQALGLGRPVITYLPQEHRKKRMNDEQALMGEARLLVQPDASLMARQAIDLLDNPSERQRLGQIGRERIGGTGTLEMAISELLAS